MGESDYTVGETCAAIRHAVGEVVVLRDEAVLDLLLAALMCRGHVLIDDVPGVGKTLLARSFARALKLDYARVQFTPDLLPSDVTGLTYFDQRSSDFQFRPGPVFTNILLADEINRATPRTQSSLLECMQEGTVSVDGVTRAIDPPFMVIATQNPLEMEGTFPLPEAQMDRFLFRLAIGYPLEEREREIVTRFLNDDPLAALDVAASPDRVRALMAAPASVHMSPDVTNYVVSLARATREIDGVRIGASPRGTLYLARASQALAAVRGRAFVLPDDVQDAAVPVLGHRLVPDVDSALYGTDGAELVAAALASVEVPVGTRGDSPT